MAADRGTESPTAPNARRKKVRNTKRAKAERIDIRVGLKERRLLALAATRQHLNLSDYIRSVVLRQAERDIAEVFGRLPPEQWDRLEQILAAPARDLPELEKILKTPRMFRSRDDE